MILNRPWAIDVDGVVCDFYQGLLDLFHLTSDALEVPKCRTKLMDWNLPPKAEKFYHSIVANEDTDFWAGLMPLHDAVRVLSSLNRKPSLYLTARPLDAKITEDWLKNKGFPSAPVMSIGREWEGNIAEGKLVSLLDAGIDLFLDDSDVTTAHLLDNEIEAWWFKDTGKQYRDLPTINGLSELIDKG